MFGLSLLLSLKQNQKNIYLKFRTKSRQADFSVVCCAKLEKLFHNMRNKPSFYKLILFLYIKNLKFFLFLNYFEQLGFGHIDVGLLSVKFIILNSLS